MLARGTGVSTAQRVRRLSCRSLLAAAADIRRRKTLGRCPVGTPFPRSPPGRPGHHTVAGWADRSTPGGEEGSCQRITRGNTDGGNGGLVGIGGTGGGG